ncbi:stage III sporulation protein AB [Brevibacillus sp. SYP-B805]|uniref:stage III sporulation protein SpoIIIAB n=1 Tax=Brevibacillus sp. SYP-B805 TaxID=1578199 RepID=UPI0013EB9016|nr:stage III sporulation protein SpoIIIAB [Brevibacillus sp. SYP-B805]NGQ94719.1 stage III sporulation protein AB [Brevibacillus sp. SYP-B805]
MVKLIGSAIILFSATMVGWQVGKLYAMRPVQLRTLLIALQMLETEIVYGSTPLHRAFVKIGRRMAKEIGGIFLTAAELMGTAEALSTQVCWQTAVEQHWSQTVLRKEEKDVLLNLGYVLGSSDRHDQQKHLRLTMTHLRGLEEEARLEQGKYENMYKSLGFLGGLLVVILML